MTGNLEPRGKAPTWAIKSSVCSKPHFNTPGSSQLEEENINRSFRQPTTSWIVPSYGTRNAALPLSIRTIGCTPRALQTFHTPNFSLSLPHNLTKSFPGNNGNANRKIGTILSSSTYEISLCVCVCAWSSFPRIWSCAFGPRWRKSEILKDNTVTEILDSYACHSRPGIEHTHTY